MSLYDENLEVLSELARRGVDLSLPKSFNFEHLFPDEGPSRMFALRLARDGISVKLSENSENGGWDAQVTVTAVPSCGFITDTERRLDAIARAYGGCADGWGFLE